MTVFPINKLKNLPYHVAIILIIFGAQAIGSESMAYSDIPDSTARSRAAARASDAASHHGDGGGEADNGASAAYSYGSREFRHSLKQLAQNTPASLDAAKQTATDTTKATGTDAAKTPATDATATPAATPTATAEQMEHQTKLIDPCTKLVVEPIPPPAARPKALESVKDRDPELYKQIQAKVKDPRYTGELGNVTVSTHDKKGRVNGCTFIQNVPYWESGTAAQALVDVNLELAKHGSKQLESDPLNGSGRTLGQEEAIVWRNSGVHAKVGKSNHGYGNAIDFKVDESSATEKQLYDDPFVNKTLHEHGWRQGDSHGPLKNDLHHWSFVGPGPATDGVPSHPPKKPKHGHGHHG